MTDRATWKGTLQIARVQISIKVFPATDTESGLSFNQLHGALRTDEGHADERCHARLKQKTVCPTCDREVPHAEIVKGFEFEKDRYVLVNPDELAAIAPLSTRVIDLVRFDDADTLDPVAIDRSYYLVPDGPLADEAFAVMGAALCGKVGLGKLALYGREYLVAVRVQADRLPALVLHTLHHAAELRPPPTMAAAAVSHAPPLDQVRLARRVILAYAAPLDLAAFTDEYRDGLRQLIAAKIAGEEYVCPPIAERPAVGSLMDALTQSLDAISVAKKTPAKVSTLTPVATAADRGAAPKRARA